MHDTHRSTLDRLRRNYSRIAGWHEKVSAYRNSTAPYPNPRTMPSKAAKLRAYSDAATLARSLDIRVPDEMVGTLHELRWVIATAGAELHVDTSRVRPVPAHIPTRAAS